LRCLDIHLSLSIDFMKRLFLSLKGYGDFVVLANALKRAKVLGEVEVMVSKRLEPIATILLPQNVILTALEKIETVLPIYNLKNEKFKLLKGVLEIRNRVQEKILDGFSLVLDIPSFKNEALFYMMSHRYLPSSDNIYTSYDLEFGVSSDQKFYKPLSDSRENYYVFPFGSDFDRSLSSGQLLELKNFFQKYSLQLKIICHHSDESRIPKDLRSTCISFETSEELVNLVKGAKLLISVDTVAVHLANYFNTPTFVVSDAWKFFIPPNCLELGRLYSGDKFNYLLRDLSLYFSIKSSAETV
jgi:ADP-heptose:LPS heptosyltransferase